MYKIALEKIKPFHTKYIRLFPNIVFSCLSLILHAFPAVPLQSTPKKTTQNFTGCQTLDHQFCHQLLQTTTAVAICCFTVPSTGQCRVEHCGTRSVVDGPPYRGEDGTKECLNLIELGGTLKDFSGGGWGWILLKNYPCPFPMPDNDDFFSDLRWNHPTEGNFRKARALTECNGSRFGGVMTLLFLWICWKFFANRQWMIMEMTNHEWWWLFLFILLLLSLLLLFVSEMYIVLCCWCFWQWWHCCEQTNTTRYYRRFVRFTITWLNQFDQFIKT